MMAPNAEIDDGVFDVLILHPVTRRKLLQLFPRIYTGTHIEDDSVEVIRGARIRFESEVPLALTPDGETFGSTPIEVEMLPGAVEMFG